MAVVLTFAGSLAGGEGRPHRRPVRQAALRADRDVGRRRAAELSRRHRQRHRVHAGGARRPIRARQLEAYRQSAATLNLLRAFATGGYANLENVHRWMLGFVKDSPQSAALPRSSPTASPRRSTSCAPAASTRRRIRSCATTDFYTSHEALLLGYEQAMTRVDSTIGRLVRDLGPHDLDRRPHAPARPRPCRVLPRHQESDRPEMRPVAEARRAAAADRHPQPGERAGPADADLPLRRRQGRASTCRALVRAVKREGRTVVWSCDPMHGNTIKAANGYKTRPFDRDPAGGAQTSSPCISAEGTHAGGVHLEMTGKNVTECTGGARAITRRGPARPLPHPLRPAPQRRAGAGAGLPVAELLKRERQGRERPRSRRRNNPLSALALLRSFIVSRQLPLTVP